MSVNEAGAEPEAMGDAEANNHVEQLAADHHGHLARLISTLNNPGTPVQELQGIFALVLALFDNVENPPLTQAVEAGLIQVLISLSKNPSDWILCILSGRSPLSSSEDTNSSLKLVTASIWMPALEQVVTEWQCRAAWLAAMVVQEGFRNEAVEQGLLEALTKIQYHHRESILRKRAMYAVANFFLDEDLPVLEFDATRLTISFLATCLDITEFDFENEYDEACVLGAVAALARMAKQGEPEHIRAIFNAGIIDSSMHLLRNSTQGVDYCEEVWLVVTSFIADLMYDGDTDEHRLLFVEAGIIDFLPNLLEHELDSCRVQGCKIAMAIARCEGNFLKTLLLEKGCVELVCNNASDRSSDHLRRGAITTLVYFIVSGSDDYVNQLISYEYHLAVLDGVLWVLADLTPEMRDIWTNAVARLLQFGVLDG